MRIETGLRERAADAVDKAVDAELYRRDVHSHMPRNWPGRRLAAGLAEQPSTERYDLASFLSERNEHRRRHRAVARPRPAHQGLRADDLSRGDINLRLIVNGKPADLRRRAQVILHRPAAKQAGVHLRSKEAEAA